VFIKHLFIVSTRYDASIVLNYLINQSSHNYFLGTHYLMQLSQFWKKGSIFSDFTKTSMEGAHLIKTESYKSSFRS
jgi:hypothetical protein